MAGMQSVICPTDPRLIAGSNAAWLPMATAYVALLPQAARHGVAMGTGVFNGEFGAQAESVVNADAKPIRTGRLPRDRQPM